MPILSLTEWNNFITQFPETHILQTGEWGELKSAFGWEAVRLAGDGIGAQILFRHLPLGMTFAYIPKGPLACDVQKCNDPQFWAEVDALCLKRRAIFLKLERDGWDDQPAASVPAPAHFIPSPLHVQPCNTLVIDLAGSEEDVFERMKPKTRYNIRLAGRKEVTVRSSDDIDGFYSLMGVTSRREAFHVHSLEYYRRVYALFQPRGMCEVFQAEVDGKPLAAVMVLATRKTGYYFYGASANEDRNRKPTYPLQWEAIRWAKRKGCTEYDMWGIPDEAASIQEDVAEGREDGLWGVYRFKRGFGGSIRRATQTLDRVYNPLLYKLYLWRFSGSGGD